MPPLPRNGDNHGDPYYTNEDVAILHSIVIRAQNELSNLPEQDRRNTIALFHVYDQILPTLGIDSAHDNRYAPILFKIGGLLEEGTLYDKFETVMRRMGIEIELDDGSGEISENEQESQFEEESLFEPDSLAVGAPTPHPERRRRHSDSSIVDLGGKAPNGHTASTRSYSAGSLSNTHIGGEYAEQPFQAQAAAASESRERPISQPPRLSSRQENRGRSTSLQRVRVRRSSFSPHGHGSDHETISSSPAPSAEFIDITHQSGQPGGVDPNETGASTPVDAPAPSIRLPETFLDMRAELFYQRQSAIRASYILRKWRAEQQRQHNLEIIADNHDWKTLVYASFKAWRSQTASTVIARYRIAEEQAEQERKEQEEEELQHQLEERERYLEDLEMQAGDARDQYFLKTIINRWNRSATREVQQILAARRQILGRRYFNAWRELTVTNEEKIRTHVLKRFFRRWVVHYVQNMENQELAVIHYHDHLMQRKLWEWWGRYGISVLSRRREINNQRRYLTIWLGSALDVEDREHMATQYRRDQLARKVWAIWLSKTREAKSRTNTILDQVQKRKDSRLARQNFAVWLRLTKHRVERRRRAAQVAFERREKDAQAVTFYRKQLLKEAMSTWRYCLRSEIVQDRVNSNTVVQAMYKWVLGTRLRQFQRIKDNMLKRSALQLMVQKYRALAPVRLENERIAKEHAAKRAQQVMLKHWLCQMTTAQQRQKAAADFYIPRLLQDQLDQWAKKHRLFRRQQEWARDAEFFLMTTKVIKLWKTATEGLKQKKLEAFETAKREMLYNAYSNVRRKHKIRLAKNIVHRWREKADAIASNSRLALQVRENRSTVLGVEIFDRWRARTEDHVETEAAAETKYEETILGSTLRAWEEKFCNIESMQEDAYSFYTQHLYAVCGYYIKEWSRRGFQLRAKDNQIRANEKTAEEYRERCLRAAYRRTLRKWRTLTLEKRQIRGSALDLEPPGSVARKGSFTPGNISKFNTSSFEPAGSITKKISFTPASFSKFNTTSQAEEWTDFDEDDIDNPNFNLEVDEASASTPAPSSVRTPLRKSGILAPLVRASTTPRTPLATPFERRLREEYSGRTFSKPREGIGKSGLGKSVGFADLPDREDKGKG